MLRQFWQKLKTRAAGSHGETPIMVVIGVAAFAVLSIGAAPVITSLTTTQGNTATDRRLDKALSVLVDSQRREPWETFEVGSVSTRTVDLGGAQSPVTMWVEPAHSEEGVVVDDQVLVTMAAPLDLKKTASCEADTAEDVPAGCLARTALISGSAKDIKPSFSELVTPATPELLEADAVTLAGGDGLFRIAVTEPTRVSVVARADADTSTFYVDAAGISRATLRLRGAEPVTENPWRFGNAIVCPHWSTGASGQVDMDVVLAPDSADVAVSDLLVVTVPVPASACN